MKKIIILCVLLILLSCSGQHKSNDNQLWEPQSETALVSVQQNTKSYDGVEIMNTAFVGKWRVGLWDNVSSHSNLDIYLDVSEDGSFQFSVPDNIQKDVEDYLKSNFSVDCKKGKQIRGKVKCYDEWLARGEGPDGSYVVGFFDENNNLIKYFSFVYCEINNNQFTLDKINEDGIGFELTPIPLRVFKDSSFQ